MVKVIQIVMPYCRRLIAGLAGLCFGLGAAAAHADGPLPFVSGSYAAIQAHHADSARIVHLWGISCGPCLAELPEWGKLAAEQRGVAIILISADRPSSHGREAVAATLAKAGLDRLESWAFAERFDERLRFEIDPEWQGELPRTLLIARDGRVRAISGAADMASVRDWIRTQPK